MKYIGKGLACAAMWGGVTYAVVMTGSWIAWFYIVAVIGTAEIFARD